MRFYKFTLFIALATFFTGVTAQDVSIVSPKPVVSVSPDGNTLNVTWATPSLTARYVLRGCRVIRNGTPLANLYQPGEFYSETTPTSNVEFELQCEGTVKPIWLGQVSDLTTFVPSAGPSYWTKYDNTPAIGITAPVTVADGGFTSGSASEFTEGSIDNGFDYSPPSLGSGSFYTFELKLDQAGDEFVAYINVITNLGTPLELIITNRQQDAQYTTTADAAHYIDPALAVGSVVQIAKNLTSMIQTIPGRESETFANIAATEKTLWRMPVGARVDAIGRVATATETPAYNSQSVPTAPSNLVVTGVTATTVDLSWSASTDADGTIDRYLIYRDGGYIDDSFSTSYTATGLTTDQQYVFTVAAIDNDGNVGSLSNSINGTPTGGGGGGGAGMDNLTMWGTTDTEFPKAFPGAFGVGRYTRGGAAGSPVHIVVTTTADGKNAGDGETSLEEALETSGAKIISFEVGGEFRPQVDVEGYRRFETNAQTTLLCATAPSPGVIIAADAFTVKYHAEYLERGCIHAATDTNPGETGGLGTSTSNRGISIAGNGINNVMIANADIMWGGDENLLVYNFDQTNDGPVENVTVQDSVIIEGDTDASHPQSYQYPGWGYHAQGPNCNTNAGGIAANTVECTLAYNFFAHAAGRNPACLGGRCEFVGNITYNGKEDHIQFRGDDHHPNGGQLYWHNNLMKKGPNYLALVKLAETIASDQAYLDAGNNYVVEVGAANSTASIYSGTGSSRTEALANVSPTVPETLNGKDIKALAQDASYMDCRGAWIHRSNTVQGAIDEFAATGSSNTGWPTPSGSESLGSLGIGPNTVPGNWYDFTGATGANHTFPASHNVTDQRGPEYTNNGWNSDSTLTGDTDGDTIPDAWETANGMNPSNASDALGDIDSDGYLNIEEYVSYLLRCPTGY